MILCTNNICSFFITIILRGLIFFDFTRGLGIKANIQYKKILRAPNVIIKWGQTNSSVTVGCWLWSKLIVSCVLLA